MRELEERLASNDVLGGGMGGPDFAREVLEQLLGSERADEIIGAISAKPELRPFDFLRRTPPEQIHAFLADESPQTIALVVASAALDAGRARPRRAARPRCRPTSRCASRR